MILHDTKKEQRERFTPFPLLLLPLGYESRSMCVLQLKTHNWTLP